MHRLTVAALRSRLCPVRYLWGTEGQTHVSVFVFRRDGFFSAGKKKKKKKNCEFLFSYVIYR